MVVIDPQTEKMLYQKLYRLTNNLNAVKKHIVNQKINQLTIEDLMHYSSKYNVQLSLEQATKIYWILKKERINISDHAQIMRILKEIDKRISQSVRNKIIYLIDQI